MTDRILIDTNILVYAHIDSTDRKTKISRELIEESIKKGNASISTQNINEFCRVMTQKIQTPFDPELVIEIIEDIVTSKKIKILENNFEDSLSALLIMKEGKNNPFFDCLLAATMRKNGIKQIITENTKDFERMESIKAVNPFN